MKYVLTIFCLIYLLPLHGGVNPRFRPLFAKEEVIREDLHRILKQAVFSSDLITFNVQDSKTENRASITCSKYPLKISIAVTAKPTEWGATFYYALHKMGFLFPHPRISVFPKMEDLQQNCEKSFIWSPRLPYRGFHFHTQHPNEWAFGFLEGKEEIAKDTIRWLARNFQNVFEVNILRAQLDDIAKYLRGPFKLAKDLGIYSGISTGYTFQQQKAYKLIEFMPSLNDNWSVERLKINLKELVEKISPTFITFELGSTELTASNYKRVLSWIKCSNDLLEKYKIQQFHKIHVTTNQTDPMYGNFNYLPKYADKSVGIFPHTVMFYGLLDEVAPMYGQKNFSEMKKFMLEELEVRPTWYFPETSYFVNMDIDLPIFLTNYLLTRSNDLDFIISKGVNGHITFTSGHENGYWLFDWTLALLTSSEYSKNYMIGLKLLEEDLDVWEKVIKFQDETFKRKQLIQGLISENFIDGVVLAKKHRVHKKNTLKDLLGDSSKLQEEIEKFSDALLKLPDISKVKNSELKSMLQITWLRVKHAHSLRMALLNYTSPEKDYWLNQAEEISFLAGRTMKQVVLNERYQETSVYKREKNITGHDYGYGWPAATLFFWKREEEMIKNRRFDALFMNIYDPFAFIF